MNDVVTTFVDEIAIFTDAIAQIDSLKKSMDELRNIIVRDMNAYEAIAEQHRALTESLLEDKLKTEVIVTDPHGGRWSVNPDNEAIRKTVEARVDELTEHITDRLAAIRGWVDIIRTFDDVFEREYIKRYPGSKAAKREDKVIDDDIPF